MHGVRDWYVPWLYRMNDPVQRDMSFRKVWDGFTGLLKNEGPGVDEFDESEW